MRISDWSSDVCSSDLDGTRRLFQLSRHQHRDDDDLLWLWVRPVRLRRSLDALYRLRRNVGGHAALVETVARPLPLWSARMAMAQSCTGQAATDALIADGAAEHRRYRKSVVLGQSGAVRVDNGCRRNQIIKQPN